VVPHLENLCNPETQLEINNTDTNTSQSEGSSKRVMLDWCFFFWDWYVFFFWDWYVFWLIGMCFVMQWKRPGSAG